MPCASTGVPAVITYGACASGLGSDGGTIPEILRKLEEAGADVVGLNCHRGMNTMLPLITEVRRVCKVCQHNTHIYLLKH